MTSEKISSGEMALKELGIKYQQIFGHIRCVLIDLSGTLHVGNTPVPGSLDGVEKLRNAGLQIRFVTNTTLESKKYLLGRLARLGFRVEPNELFTSLTAARNYIDSNKLRPDLLIEEAAMEDFEGVETCNPNAVVVGLSPSNFHFERLNKSFQLLLNGAPLIGVHKGRMHRVENGLLSLGPGPFIAALEYASSSRAHIVGKPEEAFFSAAIASTGCTVGETVMIGDDVEDDVGGAIKCGMKGILVKTGKYRDLDELRINPLAPSLVADNFAEAVQCIVAAIGST